MDPSQVVAATVAAIERGEIRDAVAPVPCTKFKQEGKKMPGAGTGSHKYPITDGTYDHLRGYQPGEKTTREYVALVLRIMRDNGGPGAMRAMAQTEIRDKFALEIERPATYASAFVSASLLWLRATGLVRPGRKSGRTQIWILEEAVTRIVEEAQLKRAA